VSWAGLETPIAIAPAMIPVSPEFAPFTTDDGPSLLELAAVTGGRERIVLDDIWKELPPKHRFFDMTPILAILAMLCLLLSKLPVFIRRKRPAMAQPAVQRPAAQTAQAIVTAKPKHAEKQPQSPQPEAPSATKAAPTEPPPESSNSISDALKRVRKR
ncbi:MAG: hypothetical protein J6W23_03760, partial [Victivallales bacterium]|nr:hypothetical protein [Victivallales bacterium]